MRGGGIGPRRQQRHDRRVIATRADRRVIAKPRVIDLGHKIAFAHPRFDPFENPPMHFGHQLSGHPHVIKLARRFDRALPVHQRGGIGKAGVGQVVLQGGKSGGGKIVIVHLHPDPRPRPAALGDALRQEIHRVAFGRLHIMIGVTDDIVMAHEHRAFRAIGVLAAAEPHRIARHPHKHTLMHIKRPAVITGQPSHVRRIADDQKINPPCLHRLPGPGDAGAIFGLGEMQCRADHSATSLWFNCEKPVPFRPGRRADTPHRAILPPGYHRPFTANRQCEIARPGPCHGRARGKGASGGGRHAARARQIRGFADVTDARAGPHRAIAGCQPGFPALS